MGRRRAFSQIQHEQLARPPTAFFNSLLSWRTLFKPLDWPPTSYDRTLQTTCHTTSTICRRCHLSCRAAGPANLLLPPSPEFASPTPRQTPFPRPHARATIGLETLICSGANANVHRQKNTFLQNNFLGLRAPSAEGGSGVEGPVPRLSPAQGGSLGPPPNTWQKDGGKLTPTDARPFPPRADRQTGSGWQRRSAGRACVVGLPTAGCEASPALHSRPAPSRPR